MFQKLIQERPALIEYWGDLLKNGAINTSKGSISLLERPCGDKTLIVRDTVNDILFHTVTGRLDITRAVSTVPNKYSFRVSKMEDLDPEDLDIAFDRYEGFESSLRDLYRSVDAITEAYEHESKKRNLVRKWIMNRGNRLFLYGSVVYILMTAAILFLH